MERAGIRVIHGTRGIKVHAKLCLIRRQEGDKSHLYALLSTGNFNEDTARVYADHGLMTADPRLTAEVHRIFRRLGGEDVESDFEHLLVAPDHLRDRFNALIDAETEAARQGRPSGITAKMNSLQDRRIIDKLYEASTAGVPVRLLVRGICCLRPGVEGLSDSIEITSIVDRFLEHSRIFMFHADGAEKFYLASADWMTRNLNRRVEVAFPIYDPDVRNELRHVLDLQCRGITHVDLSLHMTLLPVAAGPFMASLTLDSHWVRGLDPETKRLGVRVGGARDRTRWWWGLGLRFSLPRCRPERELCRDL